MKQQVDIQYYTSPCGELVLGAMGEQLCLCDWNEKACAERNRRRLIRLLDAEFVERDTDILQRVRRELDEYFDGRRTTFSIPLYMVGTEFQKRVWQALLEIPYGETRTYKDIALRVDNLRGVRAVAQAIGSNGISIFIPCHRVVGSDHSLTGFAGGLDAKRILLARESGISVR